MRINKITSGKILEQGLNNVIWLNGLIDDLKLLDNLTQSGDYKKSPDGILNYYKTHKILFQKLLNLFYKTVTKDVKEKHLFEANSTDTDLKLFNMSVFKSFNCYCSVIDKMFIKKCLDSIISSRIDLSLLNLCEDQDLKNYTFTKNHISSEDIFYDMLASDRYSILMSNNDHKFVMSLLKAMLCIIINIEIGTNPDKSILREVSEFQGVANNIKSL